MFAEKTPYILQCIPEENEMSNAGVGCTSVKVKCIGNVLVVQARLKMNSNEYVAFEKREGRA